MAVARSAVDLPDPARPGRAQDPPAAGAGCGWRCPGRRRRREPTRSWSWSPTRSTSRRSSSSATSPSWSSGGSSRCCQDRQAPRRRRSRRSWPPPARARSRSSRRLRDAGRRHAGARRGRDPGHAAPGHGRRPRRRPRGRDRHELTPELRAEGDARELQRAVQDLRKEAELELDDRIELWVDGLAPRSSRTSTSWPDTLADEIRREAPPEGLPVASVQLERARCASRSAHGDGLMRDWRRRRPDGTAMRARAADGDPGRPRTGTTAGAAAAATRRACMAWAVAAALAAVRADRDRRRGRSTS